MRSSSIICLILGLLFISVYVIYFNFYSAESEEEDKSNQYQGPVPEGYDENYFRKTGITKPLERVNNG